MEMPGSPEINTNKRSEHNLKGFQLSITATEFAAHRNPARTRGTESNNWCTSETGSAGSDVMSTEGVVKTEA